MKIIGVTGPTGAGKTTALRAFEKKGAAVIDCDAVYHELLLTSQDLLDELRERFGAGVFFPDGKLDRKAVGRRVFGDQKALEDLNRITHRYVGEEVQRRLRKAEQEGRKAAAVDAIALIEGGLSETCDVVVGVLAPEETRVERIMQREGISREYAESRVKAQKPEAFYRAHCTDILVNDGDEADFEEKAGALYDKWIGEGTESR